MNSIDIRLEKIKKAKRIGLMTHVVVGYPDLNSTVKLAQTLAEAGSDFIELQIPFSDPIADGPTIMKASEEALKNGTTVLEAFRIAKELSKKILTPLLFMGYYNTVFRYGVERFCKDAQMSGISGLIIPDIPLDEEPHEYFYRSAEKYNLYPIRVISPASTPERLKLNAAMAKGFVYCVSRFGVTGSKSSLDPRLQSYLKTVRQYFNIPLAVGFGISKREHIQAIEKHADIAIVGSAIIDIIKNDKTKKFDGVQNFISSLIKR